MDGDVDVRVLGASVPGPFEPYETVPHQNKVSNTVVWSVRSTCYFYCTHYTVHCTVYKNLRWEGNARKQYAGPEK